MISGPVVLAGSKALPAQRAVDHYDLVGEIGRGGVGVIMKGRGFGVLLNIVIGIVGGVLGGWLFSLLGADPGSGLIGSIVTATIGAVLLLWIAGKLKG